MTDIQKYMIVCEAYEQKAYNFYSQCEDLSLHEIFIEASRNKKVEEKVEKNDETVAKGDSALTKAIQALKAVINKIISAISNFFDKITMKGDERINYDEFLRQAKQDPELRGKTISVKDYRKIIAEEDAYIAECEKRLAQMKRNAKTPFQDLIARGKQLIKGTGEALVTNVSVEMAIKMAQSNKNVAIAIKNTLEFDQRALEQLEKVSGKGSAKGFKKDIDALATSKMGFLGMTALRRAKINVLYKKEQYLQDAARSAITGCVKQGGFWKRMLKNKDSRKVITGSADIVGTAVGSATKTAVGIKSSEIKENIKNKIETKTGGRLFNKAKRAGKEDASLEGWARGSNYYKDENGVRRDRRDDLKKEYNKRFVKPVKPKK